MNRELEVTLRKRIGEGRCVICGEEIKDKKPEDILSLHHFCLGEVKVCMKHIKELPEKRRGRK